METAKDLNTRDVLACDESFFDALLTADRDSLDDLHPCLRSRRGAMEAHVGPRDTYSRMSLWRLAARPSRTGAEAATEEVAR